MGCRRLRSAFEGILLQSERRWRSLATCHRENEEREEARERSLLYIILYK